jgi:hypothetical protein
MNLDFPMICLRTHGSSQKRQRCFGVHHWGAKERNHVIEALLGGALLAVSVLGTTRNTAIFDA